MRHRPVTVPPRFVWKGGELHAVPPHAIRRRINWRAILRRLGVLFALGGLLLVVSTPQSGWVCIALGLLALIGARAE